MESKTETKKIEETVIAILKEADLEEATEYKVRAAAAVRLGVDLSGLDHKWLVRRVVESYLLSLDERKPDKAQEQTEEVVPEPETKREPRIVGSRVICKLSEKRGVAIHDFRGKTLVAIREYNKKYGKLVPSARGISLTTEQWSAFRKSVPSIEAAITKMESLIRSNDAGKQTRADVSNSKAVVAQGLSTETKQIETEFSNIGSAAAPQNFVPIETKQIEAEVSNSVSAATPQGLVPMEIIETEGDISNSVSACAPRMEKKETEGDISNSVSTAPKGLGPKATKQTEAHMPNSASGSASQGLDSMETKQTEADISNSVSASAPRGFGPMGMKQTEVDLPNAASGSALPGLVPTGTKQTQVDVSNSVSAYAPRSSIPIQTTRLDGKNYCCWMPQMELFLKKLTIAYVLIEPCPSIAVSPEASFKEIARAKSAMQKWVDDDYICRHSILNSLSDRLFDQYSKKTTSAKELWEELKLAYDEDFGTRRSEVNKYIQFQIVDGISIIEQVQELHKIADSIIASGMWIDETFHVSTIISKLPPSWKEYRMKLMHKEFLPVNKLMYHLRVEEESRNCVEKYEPFTKAHVGQSRKEIKLGPKKRILKRHWEMVKDNKIIFCFNCGQKGHISKYCQQRKVYVWEKKNDEIEAVPVVAEANIADRIVK
ncbi:RNA polymerase II transcriptional coactivator KELP like [Actinidia chinensis var. chinensis]|uniref:RNA polymerase II transcriptional coactivator KELP like n=1 Tax=Actinidia chinensis var. chinensis TaxID=1590841 RepID=A0A2R6QNZ1_ACTCC|nr:RNA polymerase II transcriptional coactivator KELP like [Actinidia chinensis var. chinensis]